MTKIRDRYGVKIFRQFVDRIVEQCQQAGVVRGKRLDLDPTQVEANSDKDATLPRFYIDVMNEHLGALFPTTAPSPQDAQPAPEPARLRLPVDLPPDAEAELAAQNTARHDWIVSPGTALRRLKRFAAC